MRTSLLQGKYYCTLLHFSSHELASHQCPASVAGCSVPKASSPSAETVRTTIPGISHRARKLNYWIWYGCHVVPISSDASFKFGGAESRQRLAQSASRPGGFRKSQAPGQCCAKSQRRRSFSQRSGRSRVRVTAAPELGVSSPRGAQFCPVTAARCDNCWLVTSLGLGPKQRQLQRAILTPSKVLDTCTPEHDFLRGPPMFSWLCFARVGFKIPELHRFESRPLVQL